MERIGRVVARRRELFQEYAKRLKGERGVKMAMEAGWAKSVFWQICVVLTEEFGCSKDDAMARLQKNGVETRSFFCPMNLQPLFSGQSKRFPDLRGKYPVSDYLWEHGLYLPSGLGLTEGQIDEVVEKLLQCRR